MNNVSYLIPHSGEMVLVDSVVECTANHIITQSELKDSSPFVENGSFGTYQSIEMMAQSIGVMRGLSDKSSCNKLGFLLSARKIEIYKPKIAISPTNTITIKATMSMQDESGFGVYDCEVYEGKGLDNLIVKGSISVLNPSEEMLENMFNEENI